MYREGFIRSYFERIADSIRHLTPRTRHGESESINGLTGVVEGVSGVEKFIVYKVSGVLYLTYFLKNFLMLTVEGFEIHPVYIDSSTTFNYLVRHPYFIELLADPRIGYDPCLRIIFENFL